MLLSILKWDFGLVERGSPYHPLQFIYFLFSQRGVFKYLISQELEVNRGVIGNLAPDPIH
jgi:hypothetical protein